MKKTNRLKITLTPALETREDVETTMNDLALTEAHYRRLQSQVDAEILAVKDRHAANLAIYQETMTRLTQQLHDWSVTHPDEFPKDRKSLRLTSGLIGFRTGQPKLALVSRKFTFERALSLVRELLPGFIRTKDEIDREALIAQRSEPVIAAALPRCGLIVTQDESFFAEPDLTQFENRQTQKATAA